MVILMWMERWRDDDDTTTCRFRLQTRRHSGAWYTKVHLLVMESLVLLCFCADV